MGVNRVHQLKAGILFALAHPTRIAILEILRKGELSVGQIAERLALEQANCSQHLSILRAKGVVVRRKSANHSYYVIGDGSVVRLLDEINDYTLRQLSDTVATFRGIDPAAREVKR